MLRAILVAAALTAAGAAPAWAQYSRHASNWGHGHAPYGYDNGTSALGRYCPPGEYPHSWPDQGGVRCEPTGGSTVFQPAH